MPYDIVVDTNVIIAGLRSRDGASYRLLRLLGDDRIHLHLSVPLLFEYEAAARRPELGVPLSGEEIDEFVESLRGWGECMRYSSCGGRTCVTRETFNRRDFVGCEEFGIEAITPAHFLRILGERT